jgi:hypothetical protein
MTPCDLLGWFAASLVFATFCARDMVPLRILAIASNVAFIGYGYLDHLWPIVVVHVAMLPMNAIRFRQARVAVGEVARAPMDESASAGSATAAAAEFRIMRSVTARRELVSGDENVRRYAAAR